MIRKLVKAGVSAIAIILVRNLHAGITQLITVMVADKLHKHQYIRSLKPLIA